MELVSCVTSRRRGAIIASNLASLGGAVTPFYGARQNSPVCSSLDAHRRSPARCSIS
ncbi:hypothetical protein ACFPRL_24450 [Pseudoclavibacter helvolus]